MAKPRTPTNVLELRGAFKKDPKRGAARVDEPEATDDIGDPPEWFSPEADACWREIVALAHAGTLSQADRLVVEHGSQLLAKLRGEDWEVHPTLLVRWEAFLGKLGMTPADRSKVSAKKAPPNADPLDEFQAAG